MAKWVDFRVLRQKIKKLRRGTPLYNVLKEELTALGYWKAKKRGNPKAGYAAQQERLAGG